MATSPMQTPQPLLTNLPSGLSPSSIDTLPVLSAILSRLQPPTNILNPVSNSPASASPSQLANGTSAISIKDIPTATDDLKHRLQKARVQVRELPDIERTVEEQEEEIRELEEKIARQREVLDGLRLVGAQARKEREDREREKSAMEGVES